MTAPYELFICYRHASSEYAAASLYWGLAKAFGEVVFIDHDCLRGGDQWREEIDGVMASVDTVVVLLAQGWLTEFSSRAQDGQSDEMRRELSLALHHRKRLYPVLLNGAASPTRENAESVAAHPALFAVVRALADSHSRRWPAGSPLDPLIQDLSEHLPGFPTRFRLRCAKALKDLVDAGIGDDRLALKFASLPEAVPRLGVQQGIREALNRNPRLLVIHAEEGMGKTIALGWALQMLSDRPVLTSDATRFPVSLGLMPGCARLLSALGLSDTESRLALQEPLVLAIDGLNEAPDLDWEGLLRELFRQGTDGRILLIVTVRSGYWKTVGNAFQREPGLKELQIRPLDNPEFQAMADRLRFEWRQLIPDVVEQLRKPRMLKAAARIPPQQLEGIELSDALLHLLDLKQRGTHYRQLSFAHFELVLREMGKRAKARIKGFARSDLEELLGDLGDGAFAEGLDELCDAGVLERQPGRFVANDVTSAIALGLHLLETLRDSGSTDPMVLEEQIRAELADSQADVVGIAVANAIVAGLLDRVTGTRRPLAQPDPVLTALLGNLMRHYNSPQSPKRLARWLLPELVWLIEHAPNREAERLMAHALRAESSSPWATEFFQRLQCWFSGVDIAQETLTGPSQADRVRARQELFDQAKAFAQLRVVSPKEARLRRVGLKLAAELRMSPHALPLLGLVLGVATQPAEGWDALARWVRATDVDWWPVLDPIWQKIASAAPDTALFCALAHCLRSVWPTPQCWSTLTAAPIGERHVSEDFIDLGRLATLAEPNDTPTSAELQALDMRTKPAHASLRLHREISAALAIWMPDRLRHLVDRWADDVATDAKGVSFPGGVLDEYAPRFERDFYRDVNRATEKRNAKLKKARFAIAI